jgi:hypothetical protein
VVTQDAYRSVQCLRQGWDIWHGFYQSEVVRLGEDGLRALYLDGLISSAEFEKYLTDYLWLKEPK